MFSLLFWRYSYIFVLYRLSHLRKLLDDSILVLLLISKIFVSVFIFYFFILTREC